jgi:hypothetical protein
MVEALPALWAARGATSPSALAVGIFSIAGIALLRRMALRFPGHCWSLALHLRQVRYPAATLILQAYSFVAPGERRAKKLHDPVGSWRGERN